MESLTKEEITTLKIFIKDHDGYSALIKYLGVHVQDLNAETITGQNEFETLRALHTRDGKVEGLKDFFNKLETKAFE